MSTQKRMLIGLAAGLSCGAALAAAPIAVNVVKPELVSEGDAVTFVGRVEGSHSVDLTARITGTVWERRGEEGQRVKKGDLLYKIEDTIYKANLQTARAEEAELKARLAQAEIDAKRYTEGESKGGVSKTDRDNIILSRDVVKAKLDAAHAKVVLCENDLSYCTITSPIDGVLGRFVYDVGNNVDPSVGKLRDVVCIDPIDVTVAMPEQVLRLVYDRRDQRAGAHRRLLRSDGEEIPLDMKVFAVDNKVDAATGTVLVRFRGRNPDALVMPGGYVKLELRAIFKEPRLAVPMSSVVFEGEKRFVYVVTGEKVTKRPVALGDMIGDRVFVSEGLAKDEVCVSGGVHKLSDGASVKVR